MVSARAMEGFGLHTITDENGRVTQFDYDPDTRWLTDIHEDLNGLNYITQYSYDEVGNVEAVQNARGNTTSYTYDNADRLVRVDYPDLAYETWTLRDDGRVRYHTDGRGLQTTYRYDADDRLAGSGSYWAINYQGTTPDVKIVRDKDGSATSFTDGTGTSSASYYRGGWLKQFTNGAGKTVTYEYNDVGLVSRMATPGSLNFDYTYNALNLLDTIMNPNSVTVDFDYDSGGRLTQINRPGSYIHYDYNARDWVTAVLNRTTGGATRYDANYYYSDGALWDHTGNPLKRTENWGSGAWPTTLRYDNVYRLTEETLRDSGGVLQYTHTYGYDQVGNRTLRNDGGTRSLGHYYDANDKLLTTRWVGGGPPGPITANFYYDGAGNMTSVTGSEFGVWTMTYDDESRLTSVTSPAGSESFIYNALGQRMKLTVGTAVTRYVYDGDRVLEETDNAGAVLARYTTAAGSYYAPLLHLYRASGSLSRLPMYDLTGSLRGLVDATGAVTDTYSLELFGKQRASTGSTPNPYRFGGAWGYINGSSGLQQLGARFYWPEIGRFIQQDPIGEGMNWYGYVEGNPVTAIDPTGLEGTGFDPVGWFSEGIMQVFWDPVTVEPRERLDRETAKDLRAIRGGLDCWDAREATKNVLVAPMVTTGLAAASMAAEEFAAAGGAGSGRMVRVTRWGPPGRWVMRGGPNRVSYILARIPSHPPFSHATTRFVPGDLLRWPIEEAGWFYGRTKGLVGQRIFMGTPFGWTG
ncbi:MAG: RHS repeat domain-containing protein [Armatimonadota bacterium]